MTGMHASTQALTCVRLQTVGSHAHACYMYLTCDLCCNIMGILFDINNMSSYQGGVNAWVQDVHTADGIYGQSYITHYFNQYYHLEQAPLFIFLK